MQTADSLGGNQAVTYTHQRMEQHPRIEFHLHSGYEIFCLISGDVKYFVEKKNYPIQYGDLMVTNNREIHKPSFQSNKVYERICLEFDPAAVRPFSSGGFDLCRCFESRPNGERNKITLSPPQMDYVRGLFGRIGQAGDDPSEGNGILKITYLVQLLVFLNRVFLAIPEEPERLYLPDKLVPVLDYIDSNLDEDLGLDALGKRFFLNRFYLSKLFKKSVGSSLHSYILYKRISRAKALLSEGCAVTEACLKSGFVDYSNFFRAFRRTVGVSPAKYRAMHRPL